MLRDAGADEVHLRISSPPFMKPCYYGIDTPNRDDLLAANHTIAEMNEFIGSDSLEFITLENLRPAIQLDGECCDACLTGSYPAPNTGRVGDRRQPLVSRLLDSSPAARTYAGAGVSIEAGDEAVERIKDECRHDVATGVLGGIGGFGGLFALDTAKYRSRCSSPRPTVSARSSKSRVCSDATTRSASTSSRCSSTTSSASAPSRSSCSTTSPSG